MITGMEISSASLEVIKMMADIGNPNSVTDAGVGALCARTAVMGAFLNVKINCYYIVRLKFNLDYWRFLEVCPYIYH